MVLHAGVTGNRSTAYLPRRGRRPPRHDMGWIKSGASDDDRRADQRRKRSGLGCEEPVGRPGTPAERPPTLAGPPKSRRTTHRRAVRPRPRGIRRAPRPQRTAGLASLGVCDDHPRLLALSHVCTRGAHSKWSLYLGVSVVWSEVEVDSKGKPSSLASGPAKVDFPAPGAPETMTTRRTDRACHAWQTTLPVTAGRVRGPRVSGRLLGMSP
jgi:hypothetical protein